MNVTTTIAGETSRSNRLVGARVLFFGLGGIFSRVPLDALLRAGADIRAVVTPAQPSLTLGQPSTPEGAMAPFTRLDPPPHATTRRTLAMAGAAPPPLSLRDLAAQARAPLLSVSRLAHPMTVEALAALEADAIAVSCFSKRLPPAVLALPRLGCLNAHPSLLPDNRGPDPLFWTFHAGATETGVTIHLMDEGLDSGPILRQMRMSVRVGETEAELEARLATLAGEQMIEALAGLASGALIPQPQDEAHATTHSWPSDEGYTIPATWPAQRAYTFACGVFQRGKPLTLIAHDGRRFRLAEPLGYDPDTTPTEPWRLDGDQLMMACTTGAFICRVS